MNKEFENILVHLSVQERNEVKSNNIDLPEKLIPLLLKRVHPQNVKQLADLISQEISMGTYKSDSALPSINQLSRNYHVSRDTVFKAFIDLKDRGMIDSTPGKGYYVTNKLKNILLLLDEYSQFKYSLYNSFIKMP